MLNRDAQLRTTPTAVMLALVLLAPTACGSSGAGAPTAGSAPVTTAQISSGMMPAFISGQYAGTVNDSTFGKGEIDAELAQYVNSVGGILTFTYGSTVFITPCTFLLKGTTLTGSGNSSSVSGACTFSETATYTATHHLNGSYKAVHGCSGEAGTFAMKQRCRYPRNLATEPNAALKPC